MNYTAETGATKTVISEKLYCRIPQKNRPNITKCTDSIIGAGGKPIKKLGKALFNLELGPLSLQKELVVASIDDEALLGLDILQNEEEGAADILLSEGVIKFMGKVIPCIQVGLPHGQRRVIVSEDFQIPPYSEVIIEADLERKEDESEDLIIEPTEKFYERCNLLLASTVVNIERRLTAPLRVMNPFSHEVTLHKGTVIGLAEECSSDCTSLISVEDHDETENHQPVRRIKLERNMCKEKKLLTSDAELPTHLLKLYDDAGPTSTDHEKREIAQLLLRNQDVFSEHEFDLGLTPLGEHAIDTGVHKPVKQPPRRVPHAMANEDKETIEKLEKQGIIKKSTSPWVSPVVLVRKKSGGLRVCIDYRKLNALTLKDAFPLPRIQDCLDAVSGDCLFSTFDLTSGYHQVPVKQSDQAKTAFVTKYGLYEYTSMPFGLTNAPATFQRFMEIALSGLQWVTCLIYLDDVVCF
ncbi:hypothetical protein FSP39_024155 [Pinctada imbricata]|uniref:Reverse transcriptase domain-containing protein n=1 Tax=Pinctada imbricata TaxID=66713 RepID=A0AA88Y212_PINIB|nr:hypothetical protein FSP39_024155 [Pinctada imbricata]